MIKVNWDKQVYTLNVFKTLRNMSIHLHSTQSRPVFKYVIVFSADFSKFKVNERC